MERIERRLDLIPGTDDACEPTSVGERAHLLEMLDQLVEPQLGLDACLDLAEQMRCVLRGGTPEQAMNITEETGATVWAELASVPQSW